MRPSTDGPRLVIDRGSYTTGRRGGGGGSDERRLRLAAVAHVALEALALAGRVVALAAAAALVGIVVGRDRLLDVREDVWVRAAAENARGQENSTSQCTDG